ncbi:LEM3/CDC50 family protein, putative [Hepatocystis sp. ex Piliocolobus tephrosceles]|nr:LEM3/CDC50 family protein, putative [Hepatocystis sp. ex Piliocolobus tephrosceles]
METKLLEENKNDFNLITVNYGECEKILKKFLKTPKVFLDVPIHRQVMNEDSGNEEEKKNINKLTKLKTDEHIKDGNTDINKNENNCAPAGITTIPSDHVKINIVEKNSNSLTLRKRRGTHLHEEKYKKYINDFKQQNLKKIRKFHYIYKWEVATYILFILAFTSLLIGAFIYYESCNVAEINIDYNSTDNVKNFQVQKKMNKPVYIYYKISNFYMNFKTFLSDESQSIINDSRCRFIKTYEDLYKFRCIDKIQTLPEINDYLNNNKQTSSMNNTFSSNNTSNKNSTPSGNSSNGNKKSCNNNSIDSNFKNQKVFPCGLVSASIFNDKINISNNSKNYIINKSFNVKSYDFFSYIKKHKIFVNRDNYKVWLNTFSPEYKSWFNPPMTSSFIKLYGVIDEDIEPGSNYKITFTQNTWPAEHWKAEKSFLLVSLRAFGNKSYKLAYAFFILGFIYITLIIIIFIFIKCEFKKLGKTFNYCNMHMISTPISGNTSGELNGNPIQMCLPEQIEINNEKTNAYTQNLILKTVKKGVCFCPLH